MYFLKKSMNKDLIQSFKMFSYFTQSSQRGKDSKDLLFKPYIHRFRMCLKSFCHCHSGNRGTYIFQPLAR